MAQTIKKIGIKNSSGTGYDTRDIGVEGKNVEIGVDSNGKAITDSTAPSSTQALTSILRTNQDNISGKAPTNHASTGTGYGVASNTNYGHVKTSTGITNSSGTISVAYGSASGTACQGNDSRLSDARKNPNAVTFSTGTSSPTTVAYDGSSAKTVTYETVGAASASHPSVAASASTLGHIKTSTGLTNSSGTVSVTYGSTSGTACQGNDSRLSDTRTPKAHASTAKTYGGSTASNYGHVKLSDSYDTVDSTATAAHSIGASAYALQQAYNTLNSKLNKSSVQFVDITADFNSGTFSSNLDKYSPGNFIKKTYNDTTYVAVLADYNTFYSPNPKPSGIPSANSNQNHWTAIVMGFTPGQMNTTNTTNSAMGNSAMYTWLRGECTTVVKGAFGTDHLIAHSCTLSFWDVEDGLYSATDNESYTMLMSEAQIYGCFVCGMQENSEAIKHLTIFKEKSFMEVLGRSYGQSNNNFNTHSAWLRNIGVVNESIMWYCQANRFGKASDAPATSSCGRFPLIMIK